LPPPAIPRHEQDDNDGGTDDRGDRQRDGAQEDFDEVRRLSLEHVHRSRKEPGCISHAVHVDCENPLRLVFFEQWADRAALLAHFAVPASRDFVRALQPLARKRHTIELYDATRLEKLVSAECMAGLPCEFHIAMQHEGT
jgi:quinol monooxygenase YgiN